MICMAVTINNPNDYSIVERQPSHNELFEAQQQQQQHQAFIPLLEVGYMNLFSILCPIKGQILV